MQMWIIAMLAVSAILTVRDMAKLILNTRKKEKLIYDSYPQRERIERYARSFQKLAHTFYELPAWQERLTKTDLQGVIEKVQNRVCVQCNCCETCWVENQNILMHHVLRLIQNLEDGDRDKLLHTQGDMLCVCKHAILFSENLEQIFCETKEELIYRNRLIENRIAMAEQFQEVAQVIKNISGDVSDVCALAQEEEEKIRKHLQKQQIVIKQLWSLSKEDMRKRIFITMRMRSGQCTTTREIARQLSQVCGCTLVPARDSRAVLGNDWKSVLFVEDTNYKVLYGVAKATKEQEKVSGDNYACACTDEHFMMCMSDGMGSGLEACKESEMVVDLMEQFVTAGISRECAAKMVNAALVLQRKNGMFSSIDVCALDLYTGVCEFLKAGAAATFIRKGEQVDVIRSESMALGLMQKLDYEKTFRKLQDGDYLVMVTDGVLDALPVDCEEVMKDIILSSQEEMPRELGRDILEKALSYSNYQAKDDMTVLVAGIWEK